MEARSHQVKTSTPEEESIEVQPSHSAWRDEMFASRSWRSALEQFARATGLAVSLYDTELQLRIGPFTPSPLTVLLAKANGWTPKKGFCLQVETAEAQTALETGSFGYHFESDLLGLFALPLYYEESILGVAIGGWSLNNFPDPALTERFAKKIDAAFPEVWQTARQQPPVSHEKLIVYAELLNSLCQSFIHERAENLHEQEHSRELKALNQSARRLATATSVEEIGDAAVDALMELCGIEAVRLLLFNEKTDQYIAAERQKDNGQLELRGDSVGVINTLRVPLEAEGDLLLGFLEMIVNADFDEAKHRTHLSAVAAQTAIALQKLDLIEDLKLERASLERANRSKDEFLAVLSHELRTPLTPIMGWVSMLRAGTAKHSDETIQTALSAIERNATQELHLVNEMLDLSRILSDKVVLELELLDTNDVLASAFANARLLVGTRKLQLELDVSLNLPLISADAARLQQVLTNLISNAVKFTHDGGAITLGARVAGKGCVEFFINDTGVGISSEMLPHIFDRFRQADSSTSRLYGGLGIGLSVVRGLVELHGGKVWATSKGDGHGSSFVVSLPTATTAALPTATRRRPLGRRKSGPRSRHPHRIMVVDDSPDSLLVIKAMLESEGFSVSTASSVPAAIKLVLESTPSLIITDLGMPVADGFELLRTLRSDASHREIAQVPIIALTGYTKPANREATLAAGFAAHITKPIDWQALIDCVDLLLKKNPQAVKK